jgi:uracil-DNA glycosylase
LEGTERIDGSWSDFFAREQEKSYWKSLQSALEKERARFAVYPPAGSVFHAFELTPLSQVRVTILGQDPYINPGEAMGLSFSVPRGIPLPPTLKNIFKELTSDLGCSPPESGDLSHWATSGVLLLNTVLTVRAGESKSHVGLGWEVFTHEVIRLLNQHSHRQIFVLWGNDAKAYAPILDSTRHLIIESSHPSPLGSWRGFLGSRPFSQINEDLRERRESEIPWCPENQTVIQGDLFS